MTQRINEGQQPATSHAQYQRPAAVVVLAGGEGTRMRSATPKVLHEICGQSLLSHVVHIAAALQPEHLVVTIGHQADRVREHIETTIAPSLPRAQQMTIARQPTQRGTGDALRCALAKLPPLTGIVVVLNGDTPLLTATTLQGLLASQATSGAAAAALTAEVPDPSGLGRIIRTKDNALAAIVEERDATPAQRAITEINSGVFAFDAKLLAATITRLSTDNAQHQEYLTDVISLLRADGHHVTAVTAADFTETLGCNDRAELAVLGRIMRDRLVNAWMRQGVTMVDPTSVWLDVTVQLAPDVVLEPGVHLHGNTTISEGARIGRDTTLVDTTVGHGAEVIRSHCVGAQIGRNVTVGPFAYLRPGTVLAANARIGTFVEAKNATIGESSKVPHLTYVGDATIGEHSNIGASSVFVNYDGIAKHHTTIGDYCRTGSDTMFVAPVTVGDGAYTAAGSVITMDVPPGALGVARAPQRNIDGWVQRKRPGSSAAVAAQRATEQQPEGGPEQPAE